MSLFNCCVAPHRAVIVADTQLAAPDEGGAYADIGHGSKITVLPHLHAVFVSRGLCNPLARLSGWLLYPEDDKLDSVAIKLQSYIEEILDEPEDEATASDPLQTDLRVSAVLVGWHPPLKSCVAFDFMNRVTRAKFWGQAFDRAPFIGAWAHLPDEDKDRAREIGRRGMVEPNLDDALELARIQYAHFDDDMRSRGCGGHLTAVEIDQSGLRVQLVRDFFADLEAAG